MSRRPLRSARFAVEKAGICLDQLNSIISSCSRDPDGWADSEVEAISRKARKDIQALIEILQRKARQERLDKKGQ